MPFVWPRTTMVREALVYRALVSCTAPHSSGLARFAPGCDGPVSADRAGETLEVAAEVDRRLVSAVLSVEDDNEGCTIPAKEV